ncbi:MAG: allantoinase AllB [Ruminococcus sp.]|nr:allantoinase AllB [Ruminococcus sp.]
MYDILIKNGTVVLENKTAYVNIGIKDGKIASIMSRDVAAEASQELDCRGKYVMPGAIDAHSHVTYCDTFRNGSKAAVAGGITTIIEMPLSQTLQAVLNPDIFEERIELGEKECVGDFALWGGVQPMKYREAEELKKLGAAAFKVFTNYVGEEYRYFDDYALKTFMDFAGKMDGLIGIHAENESICRGYSEFYKQQGSGAESYNQARPIIAEMEAVNRVCLYALETGCKVHICHVSSPKVAEIILAAKKRGAKISFETCPHYLLLTENDIKIYGAYAKCNPPMRTEQEKDGLWALIEQGEIECIGSDHSAYSEQQKETGDFWAAPGGFPGNDIMVYAILDNGVGKGRMSWNAAAKILSKRPAEIFGISDRKGAIQVGLDADLMIVDPQLEWVFHAEDTFYGNKSKKYPFENKKFHCKVEITMVRGKVVYKNGKIMVPEGYGKFIKAGGKK